jgi:hypothetical protein
MSAPALARSPLFRFRTAHPDNQTQRSDVMKPTFIRSLAALVLTGVLTAIPVFVGAEGLESEIELLRSDLKTDKVEIVKNALKIDGPKADAFWPIYRKYQLELDAIGDKRIALMKDYAASYDKMTDEKAKSLVKSALDLQSGRTSLLKKYYGNFAKVLGATDAAKLVQVESLVNSLIDVQVGASLPLIQKPTAATTP